MFNLSSRALFQRILKKLSEEPKVFVDLCQVKSDLIKNSMFEVFNYLKSEKLKTKLLLQIHDELIFESPENEIDKLQKEIPKLMSESHKKMIDLNVPIKVDFGIGDTWDDAH